MEISILKRTIEWLAEDISKNKPQIALSIFDSKELQDAVGIDLDEGDLEELLNSLEGTNWIVYTNKIGPNGTYYNIAPRTFHVLHPNKRSGNAAERMTELQKDGFCIIQTKEHIYRQLCKGKSCRFFLDSQGSCILGKLFLR